jgi:membrane protease YdiL (CAAX protease family)
MDAAKVHEGQKQDGRVKVVINIIPEIGVQNLFKYVSYDFSIDKLPVILTIRIIIGATIGLGILILGEEVAWRGYLQDKLVDKFGIHKGLILLGVTWGIWHLPMVINSVNYETDNWMFDAFIFYPLFCTALTYVIFLTMRKCNSIWIAVFIHASNNNIWYLTSGHSTIINKNGSMTVSILFFIVIIFVCAIMLTRYASRQQRV